MVAVENPDRYGCAAVQLCLALSQDFKRAGDLSRADLSLLFYE
jgi:hypothetical protein